MGVMDIKFVVEIMVEYEVFGERMCREKERAKGRTLGTPAFTGSAKEGLSYYSFLTCTPSLHTNDSLEKNVHSH